MDLVAFDPAAGQVSAPPLLSFPDIHTIPTAKTCLLVTQCLKTRSLRTRDWLVTWADAFNLGDMLFPGIVGVVDEKRAEMGIGTSLLQ
jgi:hypothetical protein